MTKYRVLYLPKTGRYVIYSKFLRLFWLDMGPTFRTQDDALDFLDDRSRKPSTKPIVVWEVER